MSGGQGKDRRKQRSPTSSSSSASQSPDRGRAQGKEQNGGKSRRQSALATRALKSKASTGGKNGTDDKAENTKAQAHAKPSEDADHVAEKGESASEEEEEEEEEEDDNDEGSDSEEDESSKSGKGEAPEPEKATSESLKATTPPMATPKAASSANKQSTAPGSAGTTQASVPAKGVRQDVPLIVSGCVNTTISDIIKGTYYPHSTNHGKVVYKKQGGKEGSSLEVQIYYWDERDGSELCGWWFGPAVGGEMVWAYHPSRKATTPPAAEWNVPHDGPIDPQFSVTAAKPSDVKKGKSAPPAAAKDAPAPPVNEVVGGADTAPTSAPATAASASVPANKAAAVKEEKAARKEELEKKRSKRDPNHKEEKRGKLDDSVKQAEEKAKQEEEQKKQEGMPKEEKSKEQKSRDRNRKKGQKTDVEEKEGKEEKEKGKQGEEEEKGKRAGKKGKKEEAKGKKEEGKRNKEETGNADEEKSKKEEKETNKQEEDRSLEQVPELPHAEGTAASTQNFFVNAYKKRMEERAREEEATKKKKAKEGKESKSKDAKEVKEMKDKAGKDAKDTAEGSEAKKAKGAKETKDVKDGKSGQERKDSKPPGKQAKTSKGASKDATKDPPKETAQEAPKETKKEAKEGKETKEVKVPKDTKEQGRDMKQRDDKKEEKRKNDKERKVREEKVKQKDSEEQKEEEEDEEDAQSGQEERDQEHEKKKRKVDHSKTEKVAERKRERDSKLRDDAKPRKRKDKSCDEDEESPRRPDRRKRRRERRRCSSDDEPATYKSRRRRRSEDRKRRNDSEDDDPPRRRDDRERRRTRDDRREEDRKQRDDSCGSRSRGRHDERPRKREEGRREDARDQRDSERDADKGKQHENEEKQHFADRKEREEEEKEKGEDNKQRSEVSSDGGAAKNKAKPDDEAAGGKDLEARALRQQQATLAVLSCFHKLSDVRLETFEDIKVEFDRVMKNELPDTGAQQDILRAEATRVFGYAQQYVEEMKEKLRLEEATRQKRESKAAATSENDRATTADKQETNKEVQEVEAPPMPEETEEERATRREEERKRKEDERRRHEAELQRKREERRRKEREAHEKEEEKKKAERDARKKEEEEKKRQEEEKDAEERRLKEEVDQQKNKEESKVRREQQATLAVLRGLQKLSDASPDNFEALRTEFEKVMTVELPDTGAQQDMLKAEADRVFGYAQQYVEQVKAQKKQSVQEEAQKQEKAKELLTEFQKLLVAVESETGKVQSVAAPLTSEQKLPDEEVLRLSKAVKQAAEKGTGACAACTQFLELKRQNILEAESTREESVKVLSLGQARNQTALQQISEAMKTANNNRDRIAKSMAPMLWTNKASDIFHKYDMDGDGFLSRAEVLTFAKREYNFALPAENLDRIFRQLAEPGSVGLPSAKFQHLKTAVGIARHEDRCRLRRLSPEERKRREQADAAICEAVAAERRATLKQTCTSMQREIDSLEPVVAAAESLGEEFHAAASQLKAKALLAKAVDMETKLTSGQSQLTKVQRLVRGVRKDMQDLKETMAEEHSLLCGKVDDLGIRLKKVTDSIANRKQQILTKAFEKYESLRLDVAGKLRACIEALGGKAVDLFQVVNRGGGEKVSTDDVRHFLRENQCDLEPEKLDKVFFACATGYIMDDEDDIVPPNSVLRIGREDFMRIIRVYCKVVKEIILSDNLLIDQSEQIRRMEVGEVMEVYQGPVNEPAVNVLRIHGRVLSDGQVGWVTISGKDGLTFLVPGGNVFRVTRPCAVSEDLHGLKTTRMSLVGEVLEVLDWSRTSRSAVGITRVRARARADGVIGWVTVLDSGTNTRYLEVV